jgi:hypothetical protein
VGSGSSSNCRSRTEWSDTLNRGWERSVVVGLQPSGNRRSGARRRIRARSSRKVWMDGPCRPAASKSNGLLSHRLRVRIPSGVPPACHSLVNPFCGSLF